MNCVAYVISCRLALFNCHSDPIPSHPTTHTTTSPTTPTPAAPAEFTVENGTLYILQTRTGKRTARASVKVAVDMVKEHLLTERGTLRRKCRH